MMLRFKKQLTFRKEHFWLMVLRHSNTFCNHPSTLQLLDVYSEQKRFQSLPETYTDAVSEIRGPLENRG